MINMYEIHVKTKATLADILNHLKSKGIPADIKLCKDGDAKLTIKHPQSNTLHHFNLKLYKEDGEMNEYEFGAWTEAEFDYLKNIAKDL